MKKKHVTLFIAGMLALSAIGCGSTAGTTDSADTDLAVTEQAEGSTENTEIANPWRECTEEEAYQYAPNGFSAPEGATNVRWSVCEAEDDFALPGTMVQLDFDYDELSFTARQQAVPGEEITDISGLYYDWTTELDGTLKYWGGGQMPFKYYRYIGDDKYVDLCLWFDIETGFAYSLSTEAPDLDGFDLQAIAEAIYDPSKQIGANAPDVESMDELSKEFIKSTAEELAPSLDPTGCATFTQMIDKVFTDGMGYANEKVGDTDVFFASSGTFDNMDGKEAAIDAELFVYKDGVDTPYEIGKVISGGTAYPLTINDKYLYTASNHWVCKYTVSDGALSLVEMAAVSYDSDGNGTFSCDSDEQDYSNLTSEEAEEKFNALFDEMMNGEVVSFSTVSR